MRDPEIERCLAELDRLDRLDLRRSLWSMLLVLITGINVGVGLTTIWKVEPLQEQAIERGFAERDEKGNWRWKQ